jgi:hypothetical protein
MSCEDNCKNKVAQKNKEPGERKAHDTLGCVFWKELYNEVTFQERPARDEESTMWLSGDESPRQSKGKRSR